MNSKNVSPHFLVIAQTFSTRALMKVSKMFVLPWLILFVAMITPVSAEQGEELYMKHCSQCHEGNMPRAPHNILFRMAQPEDILTALNEGIMKQQAAGLSLRERSLVANFLAGSKDISESDQSMIMCKTSVAVLQSELSTIASWGMNNASHRFVDGETAGLNKENVSKLQLKWAFDFPGATRARSQPTVYGNVIYVGSQHGVVYAIDIDSGCLFWSFQADAEVRSAISIEPAKEKNISHKLYFGDTAGNVYSISGRDGALLWRENLKDHPTATITGSPRLYDGRLFVPMSSREWATAADPSYACCTFRGGIAAFKASNGELLWKGYSIPEVPVDTGKRNANDVPIIGPSGAPIWNSPTVDVKRGLLYVGSGEAYTSPAAATSDSILAFSIETGELVWSKQLTQGDAWNMSCFIGSGGNCPEENGPDMDIGAPPMLISVSSSKDILIVGQKNGFVYGLDPDAKGSIIWQRKVGLGGYAGGIHWGMATDGKTVFTPNADTDFIGRFTTERFPGLFALDAATGNQLWYTRAQENCKAEDKPACDAGLSAAATAIPGVVFTGGFDGQLRAYDSSTGKVLWKYQTNQSFTALSGRKAHGGSIESDGPVIYKGHLLVNSGYLFGSRMPGNVLLNFALPQEIDKASMEEH